MNKFFTWLTTSSANPAKTSLAIRGILVGIVPTLVWILPHVCTYISVCIDPNSLPIFLEVIVKIIEGILTVVQAIGVIVSTVMVGIGLVRKVINGQWSAAPAPIETKDFPDHEL